MVRSSVLMASLALSGCSGMPSSPSPSSSTLAGTWRIDEVQLTGQPFLIRLPGEVTYTVSFEGSRLSARIDCNTCSGAATMSGSSLTIDPALACTRAACPHPDPAFSTSPYTSLNSDVTSLLPGTHEVIRHGERPVLIGQSLQTREEMTLRSSRGTMLLQKQ